MLIHLFATAFVMTSEVFSTANRALPVKRRAFSKEVTAALNDARTEVGLSKEAFNEKRTYLEHIWEEIVTSAEDCIHLIDDREEQGDEQIGELNCIVELLKEKKEQFLNLEGEIEK